MRPFGKLRREANGVTRHNSWEHIGKKNGKYTINIGL
jgi:hypothetical protein